MSITTQPFSLDIFNDYSKFQNFFNDEKEIQEIAAEAKNEKDFEPHLYFNRWQVSWILIKWPFDALLECLFALLAEIFGCFGCHKCERFFAILSGHQMDDERHLNAQDKYKEDYLCPITSRHQTATCNVYGNEPISKNTMSREVRKYAFDLPDNFVEEINASVTAPQPKELCDEAQIMHYLKSMEIGCYAVGLFNHRLNYIKVNEKLGFLWDVAENGGISICGDNQAEKLFTLLKKITDGHPAQKLERSWAPHITHLSLYSPAGNCRGASQWFLNLYLKTVHLFKDPRNHFIAVCKQFQKGASEKAALLQTLDDARISVDILGLKLFTGRRICIEKPNTQLANYVDFYRWDLAAGAQEELRVG